MEMRVRARANCNIYFSTRVWSLAVPFIICMTSGGKCCRSRVDRAEWKAMKFSLFILTLYFFFLSVVRSRRPIFRRSLCTLHTLQKYKTVIRHLRHGQCVVNTESVQVMLFSLLCKSTGNSCFRYTIRRQQNWLVHHRKVHFILTFIFKNSKFLYFRLLTIT